MNLSPIPVRTCTDFPSQTWADRNQLINFDVCTKQHMFVMSHRHKMTQPNAMLRHHFLKPFCSGLVMLFVLINHYKYKLQTPRAKLSVKALIQRLIEMNGAPDGCQATPSDK